MWSHSDLLKAASVKLNKPKPNERQISEDGEQEETEEITQVFGA